MKKNALLLLCFIPFFSFAQQKTEVYLFDLQIDKDFVILSNSLNISNNVGYDSQPSFIDKNTIVFSSTNNNQTDIAKYDIESKTKTWVCETESSEFSPLKIPNKNAVSAIKQGLDSSQKLVSYDLENATEKILVDSLLIGYHVWFDENTVALAILENESLSLNIANLESNTNKTVVKNIGRSLHKIPKSKLISYINKESELWEIRSFDLITNTSKFIINTISGSEDICWTPKGIIITGKGLDLFKFNPKTDTDWVKIGSLPDEKISNITRLSINKNATKLVLVVDQK